MLGDLCIELLQEIGTQLPCNDRKSLRAVCRNTDFAMDPLFFSSIVLRNRHLGRKDGLWILESLATGGTRWSAYARMLRIEQGMWTEDDVEVVSEESDINGQELLAAALSSMMNIRTVFWHVETYDPLWRINAICDYLHSLPFLDDLQVLLDRTVELPLGALSNLRSLKMATPSRKPCQMVQQVSQVVTHSRGLSTLHITGFNDWSVLWSALCANNLHIRLKDIHTNIITTDLLTYLGSYSGIEKLSFIETAAVDLHAGNRAESDRLADIFFQNVLPRHAESLLELACPAVLESCWSFGSHNVDAVSSLFRLTSLKMSVNAEDDARPLRNAVNLLLRTASRLLCLQNLSIYPAALQSTRSAFSTVDNIWRRNNIQMAITESAGYFSSCSSSGRWDFVCVFELKPFPGEPGVESRDVLFIHCPVQV